MERQREVVQQWADMSGHTVVGWAEDIDVSGSVDPFDTPEFGKWLNERAPEWDIVAAWKLDRLGRNAIQLSKLFGWCQDHDKTVVSCSESIDLSTWAGRMLASVIAGLAEGELEAIRERQRSSRAKLRQLARWPGGKPPYGYVAVKRDDGWRLEVDKPAADVVGRIVDDVIAGKGLSRIAGELTEGGYLTPAKYYATVRSGNPTLRADDGSGGTWKTTPLRNMLRSKALRGYAHHKGETVRDSDGMPVQIAEPLVTIDEWELVQAALDTVKQSYTSANYGAVSPLSGLVFCYFCQGPMHHNHTRAKRPGGRTYDYRYYGCPKRCGPTVTAEALEKMAEGLFLEDYGDLEIRERVWVPGDSREAELREAVAALDELTAAAGRMSSATAKQRLRRQLDALDAKIAELESAPAREARWEYRPTGGTYRSVWLASNGPDERRELLAKSGITIAAGISGVEGKRSASNAGVLMTRIRVPESWPTPEPVGLPTEVELVEELAELVREDRL